MCSVSSYKTICSVIVRASPLLRPIGQTLVRPERTYNLYVHFAIKRTMVSGVKLSWQFEVSDIAEQVESLIARTRAVYDSVGSVAPEKGSYNSVIKVSTATVGGGGGEITVSGFPTRSKDKANEASSSSGRFGGRFRMHHVKLMMTATQMQPLM